LADHGPPRTAFSDKVSQSAFLQKERIEEGLSQKQSVKISAIANAETIRTLQSRIVSKSVVYQDLIVVWISKPIRDGGRVEILMMLSYKI
jgi:hypothetical protein